MNDLPGTGRLRGHFTNHLETLDNIITEESRNYRDKRLKEKTEGTSKRDGSMLIFMRKLRSIMTFNYSR